MYQTVGHHAIDLYADAMGLPLYRHTIQGVARNTDMDYTLTAEDEVEDLMVLLTKVMVCFATCITNQRHGMLCYMYY